jgi:allophanate hydrolase
MVRDPGHGSAIEVEVWRLPVREYGSFVAGIPSPLGIGQVELENGEWVQGFVCEGCAVLGAEEISQLGGWRAYLTQKAVP